MSVEILTYGALGARLNISPEAARSLAKRLRLPRSLSEDGRALVSIDFATDSAGTLTMLNPADTLDVGASVLFMGGNTSGQLAQGRILLRGDFSQSGIVHAASCGPDPIPDTVGTFFADAVPRSSSR